VVAENVRRLLSEGKLSTADLIRTAGFKPNYYYVRMRLDLDFSLSDLEALAQALDVTPSVLLQSQPGQARVLQMDGRELGDRLALLMRTYGQDAGVADLVAAVRAKVPDFSDETWRSLIEESGTVTVDLEILKAVADYFGVDAAYLAEPLVDNAIERVKAELELQEALRDAGAMTIAARNLGEASPSALRAIAAAIRTRPGE
jgi:transcriptional regulator with XRE-family HTH domain